MSHPQELVQERLKTYNPGIMGSYGHVLGLDLGGYGLRAVLIDLQNRSYHTAHVDQRGDNPQHIVENALQLVRDLLATHDVAPERLVRIGVGFGGPVNPDRGTIRLSPRMSGWEDFRLQDVFEEAFDTVTLVDNDANLIALAEATFGVGKDYKDLIYIHLSSGVGGGIVLNDKLYHGATATAGEIGHAVVSRSADGLRRSPTLEELVSISGILQRCTQAGLPTDNLHDVFSTHPIGQYIVRQTIDLLALHIAQVVALLDPEIIVLGGLVTRIGGSNFVDGVSQYMSNYMHPQFARSLPVVASALGTDSIAIGALALALESLRE